MNAVPSFDAAPAYGAPMRFFLTAPAFALAAAALLAWSGPAALASRWTPAALALTHLLALGFLAMVMAGAVLQFVAVFTGRRLPANDAVAALAHAGLTLGTIALATGFLLGSTQWLRVGALALGVSLGAFIGACAWRLARARLADPSLAGIGVALAALAVTVALGVSLVVALSRRPEWVVPLTGAHVAWGTLGWLLGLVAAVALRVVPMFQVTPPYPRALERGFAPATFVALAAWSVLGPGLAREALELALAAGATLFAAVTLVLLARRRRRVADPTVVFLQLGMASLAATALAWLAARVAPWLADSGAVSLALGALVFVGFGMSVTSGMLYRIVPFLTWLHGSRGAARAAGAATPRIEAGLAHAALHAAAIALAALAPFWPELLARAAAVALGASALALAWQLVRFPIALRAAGRATRRRPLDAHQTGRGGAAAG